MLAQAEKRTTYILKLELVKGHHPCSLVLGVGENPKQHNCGVIVAGWALKAAEIPDSLILLPLAASDLLHT